MADDSPTDSEATARRQALARLERAQLANRVDGLMQGFESGLHSAWRRSADQAARTADKAVSLYQTAEKTWRSFASGAGAVAGWSQREMEAARTNAESPGQGVRQASKLPDKGEQRGVPHNGRHYAVGKDHDGAAKAIDMRLAFRQKLIDRD